jgi:DNA-directed RNA polymerase III subunit RPC2
MAIAQLAEVMMGKLACATGRLVDGPLFTGMKATEFGEILSKYFGSEHHRNEILYNGRTGKQLSCDSLLVQRTTYYQRLKHLPADKLIRSTSSRVKPTSHPTEGRAKDGGLRVGEMGRDCGLGSGALQTLMERLHDEHCVFMNSGLTAAVNHAAGL